MMYRIVLCILAISIFDTSILARDWKKNKILSPITKFFGTKNHSKKKIDIKSQKNRIAESGVMIKIREKGFISLENPSKLLSIAAFSDSYDKLYVIGTTEDDRVVEMNSETKTWSAPFGKGINSVAINKDGTLWGLGPSGVMRFDRTSEKWMKLGLFFDAGFRQEWSPLEKEILNRIVAHGEYSWGIGKDLSIWKYDREKWVNMSGEARSIGVGVDGTVCILGKKLVNDGGSVFMWDGEKSNWNKVYSHEDIYALSGNPLSQVSVGNAKNVVLRGEMGQLWLLQSDSIKSEKLEWKDIGVGGAGDVVDVAITLNGTLVVLLQNGVVALREGEDVIARRKQRALKIETERLRQAQEKELKRISRLKELGFNKVSGIYKFSRVSVIYDFVARYARVVAIQDDGKAYELNQLRIAWKRLPKDLSNVSIGSEYIWGLSNDIVYRMSRNDKIWHKVSLRPDERIKGEEVKKTDVLIGGIGNETWFIGKTLSIWLYKSKIWKQIPGRALSLSVGDDGNVVRLGKAISSGGIIYTWEPYYGGWNRVYDHSVIFEKTKIPLSQVSLGSIEYAAIRDTSGQVWISGSGKITDSECVWRVLGVDGILDVNMASDGTCAILTDKKELFLRESKKLSLYNALEKKTFDNSKDLERKKLEVDLKDVPEPLVTSTTELE